MTKSYTRLDGTLVGTGAELASPRELASGIWQSGNSMYLRFNLDVWTGQSDLGSSLLMSPGTTASTCGNWTDTTQIGMRGRFLGEAGSGWWAYEMRSCDDATNPIYCVQTAP